jgi:hypothetical protein
MVLVNIMIAAAGAIFELFVQKPAEWLWEQLKQHETVIRLLSLLHITTQPPSDFDGLYTHALIKYSKFKPKPLADFFRDRYVREAFRRSFEGNDPSILDREAEEIIRHYRETSRLQLDYSPLREISEFRTIFLKFVSETRSPAEIVTQSMISDLARASEANKSSTPHSGVVDGILINQWEQLASELSGDAEEELERMRSAWRKGQKADVLRFIEQRKSDTRRWLMLSPYVRAKRLAFEGGLRLDTGDISGAQYLAEEARKLADTDNEYRLRALIAYRKGELGQALHWLEARNDVESINLRAAILLEIGDLDTSRGLLKSIHNEHLASAETFRLQALTHLIEKDMALAHLAIQKAQELEPDWISVRFTAAIIGFYSSLSVVGLPGYLSPWPEPVLWSLVKQDDESANYLDRSAGEFEALSQLAEDDEESRKLQVWQLACLANHVERQVEAAQLCQSLLQADLTNPYAIHWAVARRLNGVDLYASAAAIETRILDQLGSIPEILALVSYYFSTRQITDAVKLLDRTSEIFQTQQTGSLWKFWYIQALAFDGKSEAALALFEESQSKDELLPSKTAALVERAKLSGEWQPVFQHLDDSYKATGDAQYLLDRFELMAELEQWDDAVERVDELIITFGTAEVVKLAVVCTYNAKRFEQCLALLDKYIWLFKNKQLPGLLRQIKAFAQQEQGILLKALLEAQALAREQPTVANLLNLAQLHFNLGDLKSLAFVARNLEKQPDLPVRHALQLARVIQWEDRQLAITLWRKGISTNLPDTHVGEAFLLGHQLGVDKADLRPLHHRLHLLAVEGREGIHVASSLQEIEDFFRQQDDDEPKMHPSEAYQQGLLPIHLVAQSLNWPLVELYHQQLERNETQPNQARQFALLARHGSRQLTPGLLDEFPDKRLNLDITAILLAAHYDILDLVEQTFTSLRIPVSLMPALIQMREQVTPHQPERLKVLQTIFDLKQQGNIEIIPEELETTLKSLDISILEQELGSRWVHLLSYACNKDGYVVDLLPLHRRGFPAEPLSNLPEIVKRYVVNPRAVLESLRQYGPLSETHYLSAQQALGVEGIIAPSANIPLQASVLLLTEPTAEILADADILPLVSERFHLCISTQAFERIQGTLAYAVKMEQTAKWLDQLISRLRKGLDEGHYEFIVPNSPPKEELDEILDETPVTKTLQILLTFQPTERDVIWSDDRFGNSFVERSGAPIIGINEVLKVLLSTGALNPNDYYTKLSSLRKANVRFIPVEQEEIIHELLQARVEADTVVETLGLSTLRRYIAAIFVHGKVLQKPPSGGQIYGRQSEISFALSFAHAVEAALIGIWNREEDNISERAARANWLLDNLYLNDVAILQLISWSNPNHNEQFLYANSLARLVIQAMPLSVKHQEQEQSTRQIYLDWLYYRLLQKRFEADSSLLPTTVNSLKSAMRVMRDRPNSAIPKDIWPVFLQIFYNDLPEPLRTELQRDSEFMGEIGLQFATVTRVGDLIFYEDDFYFAAATAINGQKAQILPLGTENEITFSPSYPPNNFWFDDPNTGKTHVVQNETLALLLDSPSKRENVLYQQKKYWFDCPSQIADEAITGIASAVNPKERIGTLNNWLKLNTARYYNELYYGVSQQQQLHYSDLLPPSDTALAWHYRFAANIGTNVPFQEILSGITEQLIDELGLIEAIRRLLAFPTPVPSNLIERLAAKSPEERRQIIKTLLRISQSPVSALHMIRLLLQFANDSAAYIRLARKWIKELFREECTEYHVAFITILRWVGGEFNRRFNGAVWLSSLRLALTWAHAHELHRIFIAAGAPATWIIDTFSAYRPNLSLEELLKRNEQPPDISDHRIVDFQALLVTGFCYSTGSTLDSIVDEELRLLFLTTSFDQVGDTPIPATSLLRAARGAPNSLDSFLGANCAELYTLMFGKDLARWFTPTALNEMVNLAIERLTKDPENALAWRLLNIFTEGTTLSEEVRLQLMVLIKETDFLLLARESLESVQLVLGFVSSQIARLNDEDVSKHIEGQWKNLVKFLVAQEPNILTSRKAEEIQLDITLVTSSINIARANESAESAFERFIHLMNHLIDFSFPVTFPLSNFTQRIAEEARLDELHHFWPLLVKVRANK